MVRPIHALHALSQGLGARTIWCPASTPHILTESALRAGHGLLMLGTIASCMNAVSWALMEQALWAGKHLVVLDGHESMRAPALAWKERGDLRYYSMSRVQDDKTFLAALHYAHRLSYRKEDLWLFVTESTMLAPAHLDALTALSRRQGVTLLLKAQDLSPFLENGSHAEHLPQNLFVGRVANSATLEWLADTKRGLGSTAEQVGDTLGMLQLGEYYCCLNGRNPRLFRLPLRIHDRFA